ncbi:hypothetical protein LUZ60_013902 [Juncus effusus]|nr:hypothetical protein LUZ60_013902 [Juncus effusus]
MLAMSKSRSLSLRLIPLSKAPLPLFMTRATALTQPSSGAGDTKVHSSEEPPHDDYPDKPAKFSGAEEAQQKGDGDISGFASGVSQPKPGEAKEDAPPFAPSGKLESHDVVSDLKGPMFQQRRRFASSSSYDSHRVEGDREYYKHHKPSTLSNIEFTDTRKPLTRASDGGAGALETEGGEERGIMVKDTVDDSLARAERLFREATMRGDPDIWPHSRALARMLKMREEQGDEELLC